MEIINLVFCNTGKTENMSLTKSLGDTWRMLFYEISSYHFCLYSSLRVRDCLVQQDCAGFLRWERICYVKRVMFKIQLC